MGKAISLQIGKGRSLDGLLGTIIRDDTGG
jgi:hypothetical protein